MVLALAAAAVYGLPLLTSAWTPTDQPVTAAATRGELVVTVTEKGELEAIDAVNVNNELEGVGKLVSIVPEGTLVKAGETVAQLDADEITKLLNKQRVALQTAESKVKETESDLTQAEIKEKSEIAKAVKTLKLAELALKKYTDPEGDYTKELKKLQGALELARRELVEAQDELEFTRKQLRRGFGDLGAVRSRELGVQEKEFRVQSATSELGVLEKFTREEQETKLTFEAKDAAAELDRTKETQKSLVQKATDALANARSTRDIEKEALTRLQKQIDQCTIKAPADGMVIYSSQRWYGEQGQIRPGATLQFQQPIFSLPDFSKMRVKMKVHESQVKKVQAGQKANLRLEAIADLAHRHGEQDRHRRAERRVLGQPHQGVRDAHHPGRGAVRRRAEAGHVGRGEDPGAEGAWRPARPRGCGGRGGRAEGGVRAAGAGGGAAGGADRGGERAVRANPGRAGRRRAGGPRRPRPCRSRPEGEGREVITPLGSPRSDPPCPRSPA